MSSPAPDTDYDSLAKLFGLSLSPPAPALTDKAHSLQTAADKLGVDPVDLGSIISFESGGSFNPHKVGGAGNQYKGLIQFGPAEQSKYYHPNDTFDSQMQNGVVPYFQDRFRKAGRDTNGASLEDLYTTVIAGNPGANRNAKDAFGTSARTGTQRILNEHRPKVLQNIFGGQEPGRSQTDYDALDRHFFGNDQPADTTDYDALSQHFGFDAPVMPEAPATLAAQSNAANDPQSTRAGVLFTPGVSPPEASESDYDIQVPGGQTLRVNKDKFAEFNRQTGTTVADLQNGVDYTPLIGGKADPTPGVGSQASIAVHTMDAQGHELVSSGVSDPSQIPVQAALDKLAFPNQDIQTSVVPASDVIAKRQQALDTAPGGELEHRLDTLLAQPPPDDKSLQPPIIRTLKDGRQVQVLKDHGTKAVVQEIKRDGTKGSITIQPKRKFQVNVSVDQMQPLSPDGTTANPTSVVTTDGQAPVADVSPIHFVITGKNGEGAKAIHDDMLQQTNLTFPIDLTNVQGEKTDYALTAVKNALMGKYGITAEQANKIVGNIDEPINHDQNHVTMHVSRGDIAKVIGIDKVSDEYKNERAATNIANKPELDLHVGRDFTKDDAESLRQTLGDRAGTGVAALLAIGGKTSTMLAGAVRLLAAGRHDDTGIGDFLKEAGESTQGLLNASGKKELTYDKDGRPVLSDDLTSIIEKKGIEIVGDLARLYAMSAALPGASSLAGKAAEGGTLFGTQSALDTAGSGAPGSEVAKQTLKGIGVGATFGVAGAAGEGLTDVIGTLANKAVPKMFTEGLTLGTIAGSTAVIGKIAGDPNDVILTDAAVNSLFSVAPHVLGKVVEWTGSKLKARVSDDGQVTVAPADAKADVVIQKDGNAVEIDKQGTLDKIDKLYKSGKLSDAEAGSLSKEVDSGDADAAAGAVKAIEAKTANAPQESAKEEPQSKPDVQPAAKEVNPLVDDKGQPKVLYRGSSPRGEVHIGEEGGIFFSDSPEVADRYIAGKDNGKVYSATLDIKNPKVIEGDTSKYTHDYRDEIAKAKEEGHDGLVIKNTRDLLGDIQDQYVAFSPDQVKRRPAPQIEAKDNKLSADAAAEDKAKAIDNGTTTIAPNEILKTATELVNQHENELRSSSPDVVSGATEGDKSAESGAGVTPSSDNAPTLAKSVSESTKAAVDAAEAGKAASTAGVGASGGDSGRTVSERTPVATSEFKPKDRVQDKYGRKGIVYADKDGTLKVEQAGTKAILPLSDAWKLVGKRAIEVNGFKKGDVVEKKGQLGKLYERAGQLRVKWTKDGVVKSEPFADKWSKSANPEAGSVDPTLLTLGLNKTLQEDVGPGIRRAGQGLRGAYDDIKKLVFAPDRGQAAKLASTSLRAETGKMARSAAVAEHALKDARNYFSKNPIEDNYDFIAHVEGGDLASLPPDEQPAAQALRKLLDESRTRVQNLGTGKLENYIENYFPHIWEDPAKASSVFGKMLSKRPFEGSKAFLKQRVYNTFEEGLNAGLKPVSDNPVDLALLKMRDMDKYVAAHNTLQYLQSKGLSGMVKVGDRPPEGTIKIDDKVSSIQYFNDKGELAHGSLYAVEPAANIINNYLSPGLTGSKYGIVRDGYKAWRYMGNMMNQAQLGLSAFHAMFTTIDAATSKAALGINQLTSGRPVKALKSFAELPISPITNLIRGDKIYREGLTPGSTDEFSQAMANLIAEAGGRFKMDDFYHTKAAQRMMDAFKRGNILGGLVRTPGAALDVASRPLMQWLVPRQKLGVAADMMQHTLERLGPDATTEQIREAIGKDWDSVDNRMGQLVYDNLFWNKTIKDLSMASVRSVGWNLGDIRELGGAVKDVITSPKRIRQATRGETMPVPVVTQRMAYAAALPLVAGTIGAVTQYLFTGKGPDELKDYFFPKTGNTDENGNPERLSLPTYMKDIYAYSDHPGKTLASKAHPLIGLVAQMLTNKDYFGTEIRNSDDPLIEQITDLAKHVGKGFMPFSVQGMLKERQRQGSTAAKTLSFFGFNPAPKDIDNTKAQSLAYEWWAEQKGTEPKTKVTAARNQEISDLVKLKKLGKDAEFEAEFERAQKAGVISTADRAQVNQRMTRNFFQYVVSRMPLEDALKIYEAASSDERTKMNDQMATKITNADKKEHITPQMREKMKALGLSDAEGNTTIEPPAKAPRKSSPKLPGFSKPRGLADMSYGRDNNAAHEANSLTESEARQSIKTQEAQYPGGPTDIGDLPMPTEAAGTKPTREQSQHADKLLIALDQLKQKPYKTFWGTTNMPFTDTDVEAYQERIDRMVEELKKIPLLSRQQKSFRYLSPENAPTSFKYGRMSDNVEDRRP